MARWRVMGLGVSMIFVSGCFSVHSVGQDAITPVKGRPISVTQSETVWFSFHFANDFVFNAYDDFLNQCKDGNIHNVASRLSTENSFLHWFYHFRISGVCVSRSQSDSVH